MKNSQYNKLFINNKSPKLAVLIDPDKCSDKMIGELKNKSSVPDFILVGGSHVSVISDKCIAEIKKVVKVPVLLFPGNPIQISSAADAVLLLILISGRNPEYLIGHHVTAAPLIRQHKLETIPTGYMLVGDHAGTSVSYITQTMPIPENKTEIIIATDMAGEMTGNRLLYVEAGSGAGKSLKASVISAIRKSVSIPLMSGGGINDAATAISHWKAGADVVVVGTAFERNPSLIKSFVKARNRV